MRVSDDELVEQIRHGNEAAAEELINRYYTSILRYCRWHCSGSELQVLYPELHDTNMTYGNLMISYVEPGKVTGFYERREQAIRDFLQANGQLGKEMEYLLQMNGKVDTPFYYDWTRGWSILIGDEIPQQNMLIALFLAIVLSTVFAGEWHNNTSSLVLTMKNGWHKVAYAKAGSGITFAVELFAMLFVGSVAAAYAPMMIAEYLPYGAQKALDLIPLSGSSADIFRTNTFNIFGKYVWSPYLLITVPVVIGIICVPFAVRGWARRMRI